MEFTHEGLVVSMVSGSDREEAIFNHCLPNGSDFVSLIEFESVVEPLLVIHGVTSYECDWLEE